MVWISTWPIDVSMNGLGILAININSTEIFSPKALTFFFPFYSCKELNNLLLQHNKIKCIGRHLCFLSINIFIFFLILAINE